MTVGERAALLPVGYAYVVVEPRFAHDVESRVLRIDPCTPLRHGLRVGVGVSVLPDAVDARIFYPPDAALYQVVRYVRIAEVEVRHGLDEPSVLCRRAFHSGRVGVAHGRDVV